MSVDLLKIQSDIPPTLSCSTLEGDQSCRTPSNEDVMSLSNKNITDMSESSCSSVGLHNSGSEEEKISKVLATDEEGEGTSGPKSLEVSHDTSEIKCDLEAGTEDTQATSKAENEVEKGPDCKHTVYAMSSFWREMEKLTIKDILGLRMMSSAAPPGRLPPVPETETADTSDARDSGYFTQPDQSSEDTSSIPGLVESNSDAVLAIDSSSSVDVMWESEPDQVSLGENMMLASVSDIPQPLIASNSNAPKYLKKMSKNVSVRNLHALDSEPFSVTWKSQALPSVISEEVELENKSFPHEHMPRRDSGLDSLPSSSFTGNAPGDSYSISLTDIFQYLFGIKQSNPSPSATDNTAVYSDGNSLPEAYDHFFSEFDTESFFYPLIKAADPTKEELVPIFSCSRSTNRNLQFPEAYEHFFASSSSDDSSTESDEDDNEDHGPIRVVTRLNTQGSASQISTDIYENFFLDGDHRQNFFWKNTFSLRNIRLTGSTSQMQRSDSLSLIPVRQSGRSLRRTIQPISALGNEDVPFPDPLLYHLEERISRQLAQQPFRYEDLQTAVSNPRLDASLLPLRQSDMCLVCIAFASWVLKTANPQVGDAWKAVLLANVSALSAIRYLRKYVRVEAAAGERALRHTSV
ncbi:uncharacterized protein perm1a [Myripristis murdjan]|nr:PGC-1 and ERR-induced regulator in muscle protein 1 [Myripristis murdjan]